MNYDVFAMYIVDKLLSVVDEERREVLLPLKEIDRSIIGPRSFIEINEGNVFVFLNSIDDRRCPFSIEFDISDGYLWLAFYTIGTEISITYPASEEDKRFIKEHIEHFMKSSIVLRRKCFMFLCFYEKEENDERYLLFGFNEYTDYIRRILKEKGEIHFLPWIS